MSFKLLGQSDWSGLGRCYVFGHAPMNERSHDRDELLEFLDEIWAEDNFIRNPVFVRHSALVVIGWFGACHPTCE